MGSYQTLMQQIRANTLERLYLLHGKQTFMVKRLERNLIHCFLGNADNTLNVHRLPENASAMQVFDACQALPFFGGKQVVIVPDAPMFTDQGKKDAESEKQWKSVFKEVPEHTLLIFTLHTKADGRKPITKAIPETANILIETMEERDMKAFVVASAKERSVSFSPQALDALVYNAAGDMGTMIQEADKAEDHAFPNKNVELIDVEATGTQNAEIDGFMITADLLAGQKARAMERLRTYLREGGRIEMLRGAIAFVLRDLITARRLLDKNASAGIIRSQLRGRPADRDAKMRMAKRLTTEQAEHALCLLAQSDLCARSGRTDEALLLETTLLRIF
ncbi:MAG: DNA polymerase III subunit delta [Clostridia bacterium]|nr:DNA polymerase III subunit delta [Clostridia bacterium]